MCSHVTFQVDSVSNKTAEKIQFVARRMNKARIHQHSRLANCVLSSKANSTEKRCNTYFETKVVSERNDPEWEEF
ncbi:unnamed protein product [Heterobilharzia americana]|nr:unnamed protein product [Heterobilharzia americana]